VAEIEQQLLQMYQDPTVDTKPELLGERGGAFYSEAAINLLASLTADRGDVQVVNLRNDETLPFLPDDAVIEVPAVIGQRGAQARSVPPVEPLYRGLIAHTFAYEELALAAAVQGGRDRVFQALLAHPLVGQIDLAEGLTDRLLAANKQYLDWAQ
jgi:6-phospho-beta-glucosidase